MKETSEECSGANLEPVDLICGGFPCQDISVAGTGAGLAGERSKSLVRNAQNISDIKPRWVVVENVAALLSRGWTLYSEDLSTIQGMTVNGTLYRLQQLVPAPQGTGLDHRPPSIWG